MTVILEMHRVRQIDRQVANYFDPRDGRGGEAMTDTNPISKTQL